MCESGLISDSNKQEKDDMETASKSSCSWRINRFKLRLFVDLVLWISVGLPGFYLFLQASPHEQGFFCHDRSLSYPYKNDTVSTSLLITIGLSVASFIVILVEVLNCTDGKCCRACLTAETLAYCIKRYAVFLVGIAIQLLIVEVIKNMMGVLRPNFFAVCKPSFNTSMCPGFITEYQCMDAEHDIKEIRNSRQSFPSGHSAFSMYIAAFFCLYVQQRLQVTCSTLLKLILQTTLIFMSLLCGLGRIRDHQHHVSDVVAGFAIGMAVATAMYQIVCVDILEDKHEAKTCLADSENASVHCDMCLSRDNFNAEEHLTPKSLLINEKLAGVLSNQISTTEHISATDIDSNHNPNLTESDRHVV